MAKSHIPRTIEELDRVIARLELARNSLVSVQNLVGLVPSEERVKLLERVVGARRGPGRPPTTVAAVGPDGEPLLNAKGEPYKRIPSAKFLAAVRKNQVIAAKAAVKVRRTKAARRPAEPTEPTKRYKAKRVMSKNYESWCKNPECINNHNKQQPGATPFPSVKPNAKWCTRACYGVFHNKKRRKPGAPSRAELQAQRASDQGEVRVSATQRRSRQIKCAKCHRQTLVGPHSKLCRGCRDKVYKKNAATARKARWK